MNGLFLGLNNNYNNLHSQTFQLYRRSNLSSINIGTITSINTTSQMNMSSIVNSILGSPVDISRLSKQSFDLAAAQKYCNQRVVQSRSSKNGNINHNNTIQNEERCARLSAIVNSVINKKNSQFKPVIPVIQEETQVQAHIHHLWNGNSWTSSLEEDCCYLEAGGDWNCQKLCPNLTIIKPNSIDNIQSLAHMNRDENGTHQNKKSKRKVGIFTQFLFFSHAATTVLCSKLGLSQKRCDSQSIYQFEARYFQYSVLAKNIRFCKDYRTNNNNNNNNNNGISYMIFKFGNVSQVSGTELYAICVENNRSTQQPWICQHILTLDEMLQFFNLHKQALNVRQGFFNAMRIESNCVSKVFDTDCECRAQISKIWRTLNHGYKQYVRDMANRNINSNYLCAENVSGWFNNDLVSTRSNNSINSTNSKNSNNSSNYSNGSISDTTSSTWSVIANSSRIRSVSGDSDSNSVCSSCGSSRSSTISGISRRGTCGKSSNGRKGSKGSKGSKGGKGDREGKIKNEDKFCFLETICSELGFSLCENFNHLSTGLYGVLSGAIENAIKFAQKYPDTVLTQAYIDEENGFITYELVLIAEIINKKMNKYYKFAVPVAEQIGSNGKKYYKAENILTPKMVVDNVRLNSENARFKKGTWIADITDVTKSFYKQIDKTWYLNTSSSNETKECESSFDDKRQSLSVEYGDDNHNSDYDKQKFYEIGLNIHSGSRKESQRNNRGKQNNNRRGCFKYNNNNNNNNDHHNHRHHRSNNMYNNCNNYNYNDYNNHNSYDNYDYYNNCGSSYDNVNNSHFNHQFQQNSFGW